MTRQVNVGDVGLGFMGITHFEIYLENKKSKIVAIADVAPSKLAGDISKNWRQ